MDYILSADSAQIEAILDAALKRKRQLFPEWDILYLAMPKNDAKERASTLDFILKWSQQQN